jgi:hypothetical protein
VRCGWHHYCHIIYKLIHQHHLRRITVDLNDMYFAFFCFTLRLLDKRPVSKNRGYTRESETERERNRERVVMRHGWWYKSPSSWKPQEKVWWVQQQAFPSVRNQGLIVSRKKPNSRRWCSLASRQLWTIYKAPRLVLCFASCNSEPAHNITKYFAPNLRWGCQSHRFGVKKRNECIEWKAIVVCKKVNSASKVNRW